MSLFPQNCSSFTLSGRQCYRSAVNNTTFCSHHQYFNRGPKQQCEAITKSGLRCNYKCKDGNLCGKHKPKISANEKHCKGLNIVQSFILKKCEKTCSEDYCDTHKNKYRLEKPDECPICMDEISEISEIPLECGHWIHKECLKLTNIHKCPMCRCPMKSKDIKYIFGLNHTEQNIYSENNNIQSNLRNVQELQPVEHERFLNNINLLLRTHSNRYEHLIIQRYNDLNNLNSEDISFSSFSRIIDRDNNRYITFIDLFIYTIVKEFIPIHMNIYGYVIFLAVKNIIMNDMTLVHSMKHLFNVINYNIDIQISSFQVHQFEAVVQEYIENM